MNIDKWKKKPLKKELYDIIKLQEERISELNKERMKLNVVIRNEKPIRIDTHGLDYMVDLEQRYYVLQDITKEVREKIEEANEWILGVGLKAVLLEILDKENKE